MKRNKNNGYKIAFYSEAERLLGTYYYLHYDVDGMTPLIWGIE